MVRDMAKISPRTVFPGQTGEKHVKGERAYFLWSTGLGMDIQWVPENAMLGLLVSFCLSSDSIKLRECVPKETAEPRAGSAANNQSRHHICSSTRLARNHGQVSVLSGGEV